MRSIPGIFLVFVVLASLLMINGNSSASTIVWYIPHPDDETIGMADGIHQSVQEGNENYFIFFTRGGASQARYLLRGPDGETYSLSKEELKEARVRETMAALEVLGAKPENILFLDFPDNDLTLYNAIQVISFFVSLYPDAVHSTTSINDPHPDHRILAKALDHVNENHNYALSVRYYNVYIYQKTEIDLSKVIPVPVKYGDVKKAALDEFARWDPDSGRYAIGAQSVPNLMQKAYESQYEYIDRNSQINEKLRFFIPIMMRVHSHGIGFAVRGQERLLLGVDYLYGDSYSGLAYVSYRLPNDIPLIQPKVGLGYSLPNQNVYWILTARIADYYFLESTVDLKGNSKVQFGLIIDL